MKEETQNETEKAIEFGEPEDGKMNIEAKAPEEPNLFNKEAEGEASLKNEEREAPLEPDDS